SPARCASTARCTCSSSMSWCSCHVGKTGLVVDGRASCKTPRAPPKTIRQIGLRIQKDRVRHRRQMRENDRLITADEVRRLAGGISDMTLWRWIKLGITPHPW
ncbi:MAG: hypothetical protein ACLFTD_11675, partial [Halochromatium sp.]